MATKLVIVESPAKAKTIRSYLGSDYEVEASIGHIRDLLPNAKGLPEEHKKKWWADYSVDVDNDFEPIYEVVDRSTSQVAKLRAAMKGKDELVLATDEDREGESISWHLLEVLKPSKKVTVKRIAFHEITRDAILDALKHPREVDMKLVEAQETRRILDRLYGYTLSPVLWSRVTKNLSAGRVQSPAVKLVVEREIERRNFRKGSYWGLSATLLKGPQKFQAELRSVDGQRVATGNDFDDANGQVKPDRKVLLLDEVRARSLAEQSAVSEPWKISELKTEEGQERPAPPFMTTTLQQEANRKLNYPADRTMRIAQSLYEGVSLGGEQTGLITYMRTDSLSLSQSALDNIRGLIASDYTDCLPDKPVRYNSKVRNAQEAHEAIRPTDVRRRPQDVARYLNDEQLKIYELIWKRAVACQMKPAQVLKTEALIEVAAPSAALLFRAAGKQILFDGFRRLYTESTDEETDAKEDERRLPNLAKGDVVQCKEVEPEGHETKPPARYTDATLIKELERRGIGRPSTYASILKVIEDRGYIRKVGKTLVPTFKAFLTIEVLDNNFREVMDYGFTAKMDESLDEISEGREDSRAYLRSFFLGTEENPGLKGMVESRKKEIPYPAFKVGIHPDTGEEILVRTNSEGDPFLQLGPRENKLFADVPGDLPPGDLTLEKGLELLESRSAPAESIGTDPLTGRRLLLKQRGGFYLEVERTPEEIERKDKPRWVSLPPGANPKDLSQEDLDFLCLLPKVIGTVDGEDVTFRIGKYGPYVQKGVEIRNVDDWRAAQTMSTEAALEILAQPKYASKRAPAAALQDFGAQEGAAGPVKVLSGRFGPYVTDGETNATLPKSVDPATISLEEALRLLDVKRAAGPSAKRTVRKRAGSGTAAKKAPAAAKKAPAKKAPAKKATRPKKA